MGMVVLDYASNVSMYKSIFVLVACLIICVFVIAGIAMTYNDPTPTVEIPMTQSTRTLSRAGYTISPLSKEAIATLAKKLTPEQFLTVKVPIN